MSEDADRTPPRRSRGAAPLNVLFVCTANISRSPYAEHRARQVLEGCNVVVSSAGVPGYPGRDMDPAMAALLEERGVDPSGHVSRGVTDRMLEAADLVLTFEFAQHMRLLDLFPRHRDIVVGLHQAALAVRALPEPDAAAARGLDATERAERLLAAAAPDSMSLDVEDPYTAGSRIARACADEIDGLLDVVLPYLAGRELPRLAVPAEEPEPRRPRWSWGRRPPPRRALR